MTFINLPTVWCHLHHQLETKLTLWWLNIALLWLLWWCSISIFIIVVVNVSQTKEEIIKKPLKTEENHKNVFDDISGVSVLETKGEIIKRSQNFTPSLHFYIPATQFALRHKENLQMGFMLNSQHIYANSEPVLQILSK